MARCTRCNSMWSSSSVNCGRSVVSSTNETDRHDIAEILLKVALNNISQTHSQEALLPMLTNPNVKARAIWLYLHLFQIWVFHQEIFTENRTTKSSLTPINLYWSACIKPGELTVMYTCHDLKKFLHSETSVLSIEWSIKRWGATNQSDTVF